MQIVRAREPDYDGFVERDGVKVAYEVFGSEHSSTICFGPTNPIVHARVAKAQVPWLARHHRVITIDPRGNGRSDRPEDPAAYGAAEAAHDTIAVLDAVGVERAVLHGTSWTTAPLLLTTAMAPERVAGLVLMGALLPVGEPYDVTTISGAHFEAPLAEYEGIERSNRAFMLERYEDYVDTWMRLMISEPYEHKMLEDLIGWGLDGSGSAVVNTYVGSGLTPEATGEQTGALIRDLCALVQCPVLLIHGTEDAISPVEWSRAASELFGWELVEMQGNGHIPAEPVRLNLLVHDFVHRVLPPPPRRVTWTRALVRPKRALYLSSPIGLGHARRDLAIADELRKLQPDLDVQWLTQHPVSALLESRGEVVHPASAALANESLHFEGESAEHDLHAFQAIRHMDEILVNNFGVFHDLLASESFDAVIGDEAWDVDFFLHENPELKRASFVWMTDFVGMLPMPDGGDREAFLTSEYNAEMVEQVGRFRRVRDRSIFVGDPADIVPERLGPDLPGIREWTEANFDFAGYVTGFDPVDDQARSAWRARAGWRADERVCVVSVGGTAVGQPLLQKVIEAFPFARRAVPDLRMVVVAGPRVEPASLVQGDAPDGLEVHAFVPDLYRLLAACDLGIVQGGLTTCMELTANQRPFLYFPLAHHFEQNFHVRYRLDQYGAGRRVDYASATPESIADAIRSEIGRVVDYRPVATDGAARAAAMIAELL
jgi:pimeloyl-ACP methyl ester carboxylesterase/predicted glycosyltransferase